MVETVGVDALRSLRDRIEAVQGDITKIAVDAIVNAADESLLGGGGVDGAIHDAAGPELLEECRSLRGCETGKAKLTKGYRLPAKFVIHTVGPVWRGGDAGETRLLQSCYVSCLDIANRNQFESIAFPCISTGAFGFPREPAAAIAIESVAQWLQTHKLPRKVVFCCFSSHDLELYRRRLGFE